MPAADGRAARPLAHRRNSPDTCDGLSALMLGMNKVVSPDSLRRALEHIDSAACTACVRPALLHLVRDALDQRSLDRSAQ